MAVTYNPNVVTNGLIVNVDAANVKSYPGSGTTATDMTGNGYSAILSNSPTWNGSSFTCNGTNSDLYLNNSGTNLLWSPSGFIGLAYFTIEMLVNTNTGVGYFYSKPWNGSGQYNITIQPWFFGVGSGAAAMSYMGMSSPPSNGTWAHVVCWANPQSMGYYLNAVGTSQTHGFTFNALPSYGNGNSYASIGSVYQGGEFGLGGDQLNGGISLCRIYNRVLTLAEVQQNFHSCRGRFGI